MADIPNNQLSQVGRLRGHACQRDAGIHCYCIPGYVHGVRFRLPITKNKRTFVETGLIPRNDRHGGIWSPSPILSL